MKEIWKDIKEYEEIQDAGYPGVEEIYEKILRKNQPNYHLNRQ